MKVVVWLMIVAFAWVGLWCVREGFTSIFRVIRRRPFLRRTMATVLKVEKSREVRMSSQNGKTGSQVYVKFMPVLQFQTDDGEPVVFRSESGEAYPVMQRWNGRHIEPVSRYTTGQRLPVLYDPAGEIKPCLADWASLYGMAVAMIVGGGVFVTGALAMLLAFKHRLLPESALAWL